MSKLQKDDQGYPTISCLQGATQVIAFGAASTASTALGGNTTLVRLVASADCYVKFTNDKSLTPTADAQSSLIPLRFPEIWAVTPGTKIAVIQASAGGNLSITELQ